MSNATQECLEAYALGVSYQGQPQATVYREDAVLALTEYDIADPVHVFFQAGYRGLDLPPWVEGVRIGELPSSGRSWNHRDQCCEAGVSILGIGDADETDGTYAMFNAAGRPRIRVAGWLIEYRRGADGEPLLAGATKVAAV